MSEVGPVPGHGALPHDMHVTTSSGRQLSRVRLVKGSAMPRPVVT
ncbi:hypothetical protein HMPREF9577_00294 [Cutibacterium acnes HL110PA3]|nr:hypothetical protein HMPREF9577_00294 [Cutibacterium acnes HL110PA3]EFT77228.1 hypothetical protein HMPREF9599_01504 [Cutibacterium acnes HL050PA2]